MRKKIIAGNWKMNKTRDEALQFVYAVSEKLPHIDEVDSVVCAPFPLLRTLCKRQGDNLRVGAQNMHYADNGAYTGEISADMLTTLGVAYVIVGHSERRAMFNETDETVNLKVKKAFEKGLIPILCVGETLEQREKGQEKQVVKAQLEKNLEGLNKNDIEHLVIAYEPIWAIGTGRTASAEQAEEMCAYVREVVKDLYGQVADKMRVQYGGSVKVDNIKEILSMPNIDGALVGGASLKADDFVKLVEAGVKK
ncbi:MAG TPA: triose-phosphate isomerase [Bacilli bacterium]|jgi:triosephosphate isomerase|nr:triose-phosphate isomerase [Bacilli bacterium]HNZ73923.1 triose-phosphate isomerase [Bacilli bacterium]HOC97469.1 triose-phosphate isomerase [Bacilli bacterium]HOH58407.1 triose-phosphate isomerase [Bacilli bacterium]HPV54907.1 triose-phosphate isomerase [Bacilli bacterium]